MFTHTRRPIFFLVLLALSITANAGHAVADGILAHASFDEAGRVLHLDGPGQMRGVYFPTDELDHDTPEMTNPSRYRVDGRIGGALRFFDQSRSFAEVKNFSLQREQSSLVVSVFVKTRRSRTSLLATCTTDNATDGFALFTRLNQIRFQYGDGQNRYIAVSEKATLSDGNWHLIKVVFDSGTVSFFVDNESYGQQTLEGKVVAPSETPLVLGNYPVAGRGREIYSFGGDLDELIIATTDEAVQQRIRKVARDAGEPEGDLLQKRIFDATAQPVDGNEMIFGGERLFHSFVSQPVPLTFLFKGNRDDVDAASFVLYVPEHIVCREAFASNHNLRDQLVVMDESSVTRDGVAYRRYETQDFDITRGLAKTYSVMLTIALDSDDATARDATIHWGYVIDGKETEKPPFTLRLLDPLSMPEDTGRFEIMNYFLVNGMAYHDPALQEAVADLFLASGMRAKGRFYSHDRRRVAFDNYLQSRGFTLYNISLWQGPASKQVASLVSSGIISPAVNAEGEADPTHPCPTEVLDNDTFQQAYRDMVRHKLSAANDGEWVVYDFEPWGVPSNYCFCDNTLNDFKQRFDIDESLTADIIKQKYRSQWTEFWLQMTTEITAFWTEAVHAVNPTFKISEYTYVFDYDDPNLHSRFFDIPKDPRRIGRYVDEYMLSVYNFHGRNLFNSLNQNMQALDKPVAPIALIARPHELMAYGTPAGTLSPQQIYQRAVLIASFGCERMAVYPGKWIDGAFHASLARAMQLIWDHEEFFIDGTRIDERVRVAPARGQVDAEYAHVLWEKDGQYVLVVYNFSDAAHMYEVDLNDIDADISTITTADGETLDQDRTRTLRITIPAHDLALFKIGQ